jgi:hypothetical protein
VTARGHWRDARLELPRLRELLTQALQRIEHPKRYGVVLEGSIAEGFGNDTSDVDFLLVTEDDYEHPIMPTVLFVDGDRVEVRMRSARQLRAQVEGLNFTSAAMSHREAKVSEDQLNRCQRFAHSLIVHNHALIERVRLSLPPCDLEAVISAWFDRQARDSVHYATALLELREFDEAALWARAGMVGAAKAWAAVRGETYLGLKWLPEQLKRIANEADVISDLRALLASSEKRRGPDTYATACLNMAARLGCGDAAKPAENIALARRRDVTTWQLGARVHVVRGRRDVFALTPEAARVWRSLVFGQTLPTIHGRARRGSPAAGAVMADIHRLGLIDLRWHGGARIKPALAYTPAPEFELPTLCANGMLARPRDRVVKRCPIAARDFAAAGMAQVWANVEIENAREDLRGALNAGQWGVVRATAHRMLRRACVVALTAYGVYPLPPPEAGPYSLQDVRDLPSDIKNTALILERDIQEGALDSKLPQATLEALEDFVEMIRRDMFGEDFPACFLDDDGWNKTLEIGYDWARLGAYLDAEFPIEEARDLLTAGARPGAPARDLVGAAA